MKILCINCKPDLSYFTQRGLPLEIEYGISTQSFLLKYLHDATDQNGAIVKLYTPDVQSYLEKVYKETKYTVIMVGWNPSNYGPEVNHTGGYTCPTKLSSGAYWITVRQDNPVNNNYAVHELHHALCDILMFEFKLAGITHDYMDIDSQGRPYYLNDQPENPLSNYAQTWAQIKPYINKLTIYNSMQYKYFNPTTDPLMIGLKPQLMVLLDKARGIAGVPFKITSGLRTPQINAQVGGVSDSAHLTGEAADIACSDSQIRLTMFKAFLAVGFNRIEVCPAHLHIDISKTLPQNVMVLSQNR